MKTKTTKLFYWVLIAISFAVGKTNAQMVYLPDTNFRNALIAEGLGAAIYGDSLDASSWYVTNSTALYIWSYGIKDITGIAAFVNLQYLSCSDNQLTFLPQLPSNLIDLFCGGNLLTSLPNLPSTLTRLYCGSNSITTLPVLPIGLTDLLCPQNPLLVLPSLPPNLQELNCSNNQLSTLPSLPSSLEKLNCNYNQLTTLPSLPSSIEQLQCDNNQLTTLPNLPKFMKYLDCGNNLLTSLPQLPDSLLFLRCYNNPNLTCLPKLHNMTDLYFNATAITCIPNYANITNSSPTVNMFPVCNMFNSNACDFYWNISGQTYLDSNANCVYDVGDFNIKNIPLQLLSNGNLVQQTSSTSYGKYDFDTYSNGIYEVKVDTNDLPFDVICPVGSLYSDTITSTDSLKTDRDFSLQCKSGLHVGIKSIYGRFVPARFSMVKIHVEDLGLFYGMHCVSGESGGVTVRLDGPITYISPAPGALTPTTVSGNILTYIVPDFGALYIGAFDIIVQTDTFATIGTQVCITVTTITTNSSSNIKKDSLTQCFTIVGSFDPNDKHVSPVSDMDINGDGWLIYTINFQNTGTAEAFDIYLLDTLDNNLDWSTFKLTAYSHQPQIQLFNTGLLRFNFPNINLPDSNTNEPLSHGYVQYKIKLKTGLSLGTQIHNTAYIYFDFNLPVVTNTTENILVQPTAVEEVKNETEFNVFPNPVHDVLNVSLNKPVPANTMITINDMQGRVVKEEKILQSNSGVIPINVSALSQGVYLLRMDGVVRRFVKI